MDWNTVLTTVWATLNSPAGITVMASAVLWALNRLYAAKPLWANYEGTLIAAVKYAEKAIPDDTDNKAAARLDEALRYALKVFEQVEGRRANARETAQLVDGLQVVHANLEAGDQL